MRPEFIRLAPPLHVAQDEVYIYININIILKGSMIFPHKKRLKHRVVMICFSDDFTTQILIKNPKKFYHINLFK